MSVNWKELELLLSEIPLEGSYIQEITEHSVHSFTLSLYNRENRAFLVYSEIATLHSRFCLTPVMRRKSPSMQRFTQYMKAHVRGKKITQVRLLPFDRAFILSLESPLEKIRLFFRLYSGPGANVMVLDCNNRILELLFRRPSRGETKGEILRIEERTDEGERHYSVRPYSTPLFNTALEEEESRDDRNEKRENLVSLLEEHIQRERFQSDERERKARERLKSTEDYEEIRHFADLLASSLHLYRSGMSEITLFDWERNTDVTFSLSSSLDGRKNLERLYDEYQKKKKTAAVTSAEIEKIREERRQNEEKWAHLLSDEATLGEIRRELGRDESRNGGKNGTGCGLALNSGGWKIIVGRNARENDEILRKECRGSDVWMHTRDYAGGYIIIKAQKNKTVPLNILLDGAYLAVFFSKARRNNKADIYYTSVKNLRRIKGAKTGLIIPTHEKMLFVEMDEKRVEKLLEGTK